MTERMYQYQVSMKSQFQPWLIRTYLHRRIYNILYIVTKILPIVQYFTRGYESVSDYILVGFIFFYFEIYILYRYLSIKTQINRLYGDNTYVRVYFKDDEIVYETDNSMMSEKWEDMSRVEEKKWFFFFYKNGVVNTMLYKRIMSDDDIQMIRSYLQEQQQKEGRNIYLRWFVLLFILEPT